MWSLEKLRTLPKMNINPKKKDQRKLNFEIMNEGSDFIEEELSESDEEVELQTPTLRRFDRVRR